MSKNKIKVIHEKERILRELKTSDVTDEELVKLDLEGSCDQE